MAFNYSWQAPGTESFDNIEQMKTSNIVYHYETDDNTGWQNQSVSQTTQLYETIDTEQNVFNKFTAVLPHSPTSTAATATEFVDNLSTSIHSKVSAVNQFIDQIMMFSYDEDGNKYTTKKRKDANGRGDDKENVNCSRSRKSTYEKTKKEEQGKRSILGDKTKVSIQRLSDLLFCQNLSCTDVKENISYSNASRDTHNISAIGSEVPRPHIPSPLSSYPEEVEVDEQHHYENISKMMLMTMKNHDATASLSAESEIPETKILSEASYRHICYHGLPPSLTHCEWNRVYSLSENGDCYENVMTCLALHPQTLIVVETMDGDTFGGFSASPWYFPNGGVAPPPSTPTRRFLLDDYDIGSNGEDDYQIMLSDSLSHTPRKFAINNNSNSSYLSDLPESSIHMASSFGSLDSDCMIPCTPPPSPGTAMQSKRSSAPLLQSSHSFGTPRTTDSTVTTVRSSPSSINNNSYSNRSFHGSGQSFLFSVRKSNSKQKLSSTPPSSPLLSSHLRSSSSDGPVTPEQCFLQNEEEEEQVILYPWTGKNNYIQSLDASQQRLSMGGGGDGGCFGFSIQDGFSRGTTGPSETFGNDEPLTSPGKSTAFEVLKLEIYGFTNPWR